MDSISSNIEQSHEKSQSKTLEDVNNLKLEILNIVGELKQSLELPLSYYFTAYKDEEYFGKGEENLKFSGCSLNTNDIMDHRFKMEIFEIYIYV